MNFDEGLRRVGIVLGLLGALAGIVASLSYGGDLLRQRDRALRFQSLAPVYWRVVHDHPVINEYVTVGDVQVPLLSDSKEQKEQDKALKNNGIESADVSNGYINSIRTTHDGALEADEPPFWSWLWLLVFPPVGFLLPWGAIRTLRWITSGFSQTK